MACVAGVRFRVSRMAGVSCWVSLFSASGRELSSNRFGHQPRSPRALRPGVQSIFSLNAETKPSMATGRSAVHFMSFRRGCRFRRSPTLRELQLRLDHRSVDGDAGDVDAYGPFRVGDLSDLSALGQIAIRH